jgi:hypothetical protein
VLPTKIATSVQRIRLTIPFILPALLIWVPDLNHVTAIVVLFASALIALVVLMGVTTLSLLRSQGETELEDPFIATLRTRYENEIKSLIHLGELRVRVIDALRNLQADKIKANIEKESGEKAPPMVELSYIVERLRQMGVTEERRTLESVVSSLVEENVICRESYPGPFWTIPNDELISDSLSRLEKLALIISNTYNIKGSYAIEGFSFANLRDWLAVNIQTPAFVVGEYVVPRVFKHLLDGDHFHTYQKGNLYIFVNKRWRISRSDWDFMLEDAQIQAKKECEEWSRSYSYRSTSRRKDCIKVQTWYNLLKQLPHTKDADDIIMSDEEIAVLASIMIR